jgi:hypothetical protein
LIARLVVTLSVVALAGCGSSQSDRPSDGHIFSESLPIPAQEAASAEEAATTEPDAGSVDPRCAVDADDPAVAPQIGRFQRWLQDQTVGRRLTIEGVDPVCGDLEGALVVDVGLSGPAGGLDSLARALPLYYPGSVWAVGSYERLDGDDNPLRISIEVRVPVGAEPRPRCTWDPATPCPPGLDNPQP